MIALEIWILLSLVNYYTVYSKVFVELSILMPMVYIPLIIVIGFNYLTLDYNNNWKKFNVEFENYSIKKNRIGSCIVFGIILIIICNLIFSFYLMSQVDWNKYC
jgi:hypothetical protein